MSRLPSDEPSADDVIDILGLEPLPREGGMIAEVWRDARSSAIYFLMRPGDFSAMHRLASPECWHHYAGASVRMLLLEPDGGIRRPRLGSDLRAGERPFVAVLGGTWMGAETTGEWSLVGTTMAPPYSAEQFELGERDDLIVRYPDAEGAIVALTRTESGT